MEAILDLMAETLADGTGQSVDHTRAFITEHVGREELRKLIHARLDQRLAAGKTIDRDEDAPEVVAGVLNDVADRLGT